MTLLVVDNEPIRTKAMAEYLAVEEEIGGAREQLESFQTGDLPAYERWEAKVFGGMLTKLRETNLAIDEKRRLLEAINEEMYWSGCSEVTAYRRVMQALEDMQNGRDKEEEQERYDQKPPPEEEEGDPFDFDKGPADFPFLPADFDVDLYDRSPKRVQDQFRDAVEMMGRLYSEMTGQRAPTFDELLARERAKKRRGSRASKGAGEMPDYEPASPEQETPDSRLKDLYRRLVRLLHPDSSGDHSMRARELWHELQEAYRTRDLERMEAVAGRADLGANGTAAALSVGLLRRMIRDLRDALDGMRAQLARARKNPAWNFRRRAKELPKLEKKRRQSLERGLEHATWTLKDFTQELDRLAKRAAKRVQRKANPKPKPAPRPKKAQARTQKRAPKPKAEPVSRDGVQFEFF
ncbi:MAG: J domain-containing protein [Chthoniobacteraceae bacterium]